LLAVQPYRDRLIHEDIVTRRVRQQICGPEGRTRQFGRMLWTLAF
jgi:hypothetical protein